MSDRQNTSYNATTNTRCRTVIILREANNEIKRIVDYYAYRALRNIKLSPGISNKTVENNLIYVLRLFMLCIPDFVNKTYGYDEWNLLMCACWNDGADIIRVLLEDFRLNVNAQTYYGWTTALMYACRNGRTDIVRLFLEYPRTNIYLRDRWGRTAKDLAQANDHRDIVKMIEEYEQRGSQRTQELK